MKYSDYAPTGFDLKGLGLPDRQDWLVVLGQNRDSSILDQSNFICALESLGGESNTVEVHRFRHWACGWLEVLIADPSRQSDVDEIHGALADYPVLNEMDYSDREYEAACEAWEHMSIQNRMNYAAEDECSIFSARRDYPPNGGRGEIISRLAGEC